MIIKRFVFLCFFILFIQNAFSKPILNKSKYLIATAYDNASGVLALGTTNYPLVYTANRDEVSALETDYWIVKNVDGDKYTFQNASNAKYIAYNSLLNSRSALQLVDVFPADQSAYFTLELIQTNGMNYYLIHPYQDITMAWDRRTRTYESVYPVGTYASNSGNNQLFVLYDNSGNQVLDDGTVAVSLPKTTRNFGCLDAYFSDFKLNNKVPVANTSAKEYFFTIPKGIKSYHLIFNFTLKDSLDNLFFEGNKVESGDTVYVISADTYSSKLLEIKRNGVAQANAGLWFTYLPTVQLFTDNTIGSVYSLGRIVVTEEDKDSSELLLAKMKTRGGISINFAKKSFAINLRDSLGVESDDRSFFGLRNDNNWILDAMYIDPARMRNRVSTDLWNSFATKPYWFASEPKMRNGTRGRFVELFVNDVYHGLYCMTEKIDRKQLDVKKLKLDSLTGIFTQRGALYKAVSWSNAVLMGYPYNGNTYPNFSNLSMSWSGYECKYPELDEGEPIDWNPMYNAVKVPSSYYTTNADFEQNSSETFDLPVYLDYYLFIELMLSSDNHGKNSYSGIYDQSVNKMISITPWDLDATWGIRWDGSKSIMQANQNFDNFLIQNEHGQVNLFLRLKSLDTNDWSSLKLVGRYRELRGGAFNRDSLMNRFQEYADLFVQSKADQREIAKWGSYGLVKDISAEMNYLSSWIDTRLEYLDKQYLGAPYTELQPLNFQVDFFFNNLNKMAYIKGLENDSELQILSANGKVMYSGKLSGEAQFDLSTYPIGMYIFKSGEFVRKVLKY